ncbi:beta-glucosidase BglX [Blautia sp. MSJ-19]|uniref:beta-glucosidase BglX n=1 Tax=Blautia sp. MSJ-19 TaxID=2841517 RepID=UPI001C0F22B8|nr:beta-glucosidase BglX [Blautia sp. MSJ-19]MBU5481468.1 beta-glucosidase BglX [Blautia sp. MSJ-19]
MTEEKLTELLKSMTRKEKIGQMIQLDGGCFKQNPSEENVTGPLERLGLSKETVQLCGSVLNVMGAEQVVKIQKEYMQKSRLKIPLLFMADIIYGYKTVFPIPLGMGATWNPELVCDAYRMIAAESAADGDMVTFSPPADLIRDARWGRCLEMASEDPFLLSKFSAAMVKGLQNDGKPGKSVASCVKHFAGYSAVQAGREYNTVDMSERNLRQNFFPAYKAAVDAGCELVMTSFNTIDGVPATGNQWLLKKVLREEWGFQGVVITDYAAINELMTHGVAENEYEAAHLAINATVDIDMRTACYGNQLESLIQNGEISDEQIDQACMRILQLKNKLGLFENPYYGCMIKKETLTQSAFQEAALARIVANRSCVLLKNNNVLPIKNHPKIALIGPYADSKDITGLWAVFADREKTVTLRQAMEEHFGKENISCDKGCDFLYDYESLGDFGNIKVSELSAMTEVERKQQEQKALENAQRADIIVMALGEHILQSGEAGSRTDITLPRPQKELLKKIHALGKKTVVVLFNGRPLALKDIEPYCDAILEAWFPGTEGGHSICDILSGDYNPSGRLAVSFPYDVGQEPLFYSQFSTGRPASKNVDRFTSRYIDCPNEAMYPFGFGLSYHSCAYSAPVISQKNMMPDEELTVQVDIQNISDCEGTETVQMYLRDKVGSVVRPILELKDFRQISLKPGEKQTVIFKISEEMLRFYRQDMTWGSEAGTFEVLTGPNSHELQKSEFQLCKK